MRDSRHVWFWIGALVVVIAAVAMLGSVLLPFVAGAVLAYFLNPLADQLERAGIGRTLSAALIVGLAGLVVFGTAFFLAPLAIGQLSQLADTLPGDLAKAKASLETWAEARFGDRFPSLRSGIEQAFSEFSRGSSGLLAGIAQSIVSHGMAFVNLISLLLITPIVVFYLLRDWNPMLQRIDSWVPVKHAGVVRKIASDIDEAVSAFVRGQGTICIILGLFYAIGLSLVGLRYGLVIGLATGVLAFVPIVGWSAGLVTATLAAVSQGWPEMALAFKVAGVYLAGMAIDSAFLSPSIVGQRIGLHPVWLIFALFVFSALFGMVGTLVAVPVAAALGVIVRFARDRYLESDIYLGPGRIPPAGRDGPET